MKINKIYIPSDSSSLSVGSEEVFKVFDDLLCNKNIDIVLVFAYEYFKDIKKFFGKFKVDFYKPIPFSKLK